MLARHGGAAHGEPRNRSAHHTQYVVECAVIITAHPLLNVLVGVRRRGLGAVPVRDEADNGI